MQSWASEGTGNFGCVKSDSSGAVYGSSGSLIREFSLKKGFVQDLAGYSPVKALVLTPGELLASYADCSIGIWNRAKFGFFFCSLLSFLGSDSRKAGSCCDRCRAIPPSSRG